MNFPVSRQLRSILATLIAVLPLGLAQAAPDLALLNHLADQLKSLRAIPVSTVSAGRGIACPENTRDLAAISQQQLLKTLGDPDFVDPQDHSWWYLFTNPRPVGQMGGGFPELGFYFNSNKVVTRVDCHYSR